MFSTLVFSSFLLVKIWGTTDVGQQQQFQEKLDRQYSELGQRYDRLAKATEKIGKKQDVRVCLFGCGSNAEQEQPELASYSEKPVSNRRELSEISDDTDYQIALSEVRRWKRQGRSQSDAIAFLTWIRQNPSEYQISYKSMSRAVNQLY
jgi:hypothetical protein